MGDLKQCKIIDAEDLLNAGFEFLAKESNLLKDAFASYDIEYKAYRYWTNDDYPIKLDISNMPTNNGAAWHLHIDNCDCCTIGSADISTIGQFNLTMQVFNSNFRL